MFGLNVSWFTGFGGVKVFSSAALGGTKVARSGFFSMEDGVSQNIKNGPLIYTNTDLNK